MVKKIHPVPDRRSPQQSMSVDNVSTHKENKVGQHLILFDY